MDYYKQTIYIPQVNDKDEITGKVERWEAHTKGILHRGFTLGLLYKQKFICQHRKHPVFDGYIDLTLSSHQSYQDDNLDTMQDAINKSLLREWNIAAHSLLHPPKYVGKTQYYSQEGKFIEHEVCHFYVSAIDSLPPTDYEYCYGYSLLSIDELRSTKPFTKALAPWVRTALQQHII